MSASASVLLAVLYGALPGSNLGGIILGLLSGYFYWVASEISGALDSWPNDGVKLEFIFGVPHTTHE